METRTIQSKNTPQPFTTPSAFSNCFFSFSFLIVHFCLCSLPLSTGLVETQIRLGPRLGVQKLWRAADGAELIRLLLVDGDVVVLGGQSRPIVAREHHAANHGSNHRISLRKKKKNQRKKKKKNVLGTQTKVMPKNEKTRTETSLVHTRNVLILEGMAPGIVDGGCWCEHDEAAAAHKTERKEQ
jgi:hypothetical protein